MKKCFLLMLSIMLMLSLPVPAEAGGRDTVQEAERAAYTMEFTWDGKQYVMAGDSSVALSEILAALGLTGEVTEVTVSKSALFSASNETGEWIVTAIRRSTPPSGWRLPLAASPIRSP